MPQTSEQRIEELTKGKEELIGAFRQGYINKLSGTNQKTFLTLLYNTERALTQAINQTDLGPDTIHVAEIMLTNRVVRIQQDLPVNTEIKIGYFYTVRGDSLKAMTMETSHNNAQDNPLVR